MNRDEIIARVREIKAERTSLVTELNNVRADFMTVLGRITALKTTWALMPEPIRAVIEKYTDANPGG